MDWNKYNEISSRWRLEGKEYSQAVNKFVKRGLKEGWKKAGDEPVETRYDIANEVIHIIKQANEEN